MEQWTVSQAAKAAGVSKQQGYILLKSTGRPNDELIDPVTHFLTEDGIKVFTERYGDLVRKENDSQAEEQGEDKTDKPDKDGKADNKVITALKQENAVLRAKVQLQAEQIADLREQRKALREQLAAQMDTVKGLTLALTGKTLVAGSQQTEQDREPEGKRRGFFSRLFR